MFSSTLTVHEGLGASGRVPTIHDTTGAISAVEWGGLGLFGITTAVIATWVKPSLGIPGGNDGRVVSIGNHPDDLSGEQDVSVLLTRGVAEIRVVDSDRTVHDGKIDVGKHLRPNYRDGKIVLFVETIPEGWQADSSPIGSCRM